MNMFGMLKRVFAAATVLTLLAVSVIGVVPVSAAPADCYWVGDGGNWSDATNHWAVASGGAPGAGNLPDSTSSVHFDANSFSVGGQTVTVDATAYCLDMDWTGATNNPTFAGSSNLEVSDDFTLIPDMDITIDGTIKFRASSNGQYIDCGGLTLAGDVIIGGVNNYDTYLSSDLNVGSNDVHINRVDFYSNDKDIYCGDFIVDALGYARKVYLQTSNIYCDNFTMDTIATVFSEGTSNIYCAGDFIGFGYDYYNLNLNGATPTISGSNTFNDLKLNRSGVQTITFTDGTTQTVSSFTRDAGADIKTLQGSGVGGWTIDNVSGAEIDIDNVSVSYGTVATDDINAELISINGGNNTNWNFPFTPQTNLATGISMTGFNTTATLNGQIGDLGGDYPVTLILEWGYTTSYGNIALNTTTSTAPTSVSATITQFDPEQTVHFRLRAVNGLGTTSGADQTIPFTIPAWYVLLHTLLPIALAAIILLGVLLVVGNPLAAFLSAMTGLVGYYIVLALVSPQWV